MTVEVPVEVEKIIEKPVPIPQIQEKIQQVPQVIEKIVEVQVENTKVDVVDRVVEKIVEAQKVNVVQEQIVAVQERIQEIPSVVEKIVPVKEVIREQVPVQQIVEKIVERVVEVPKVVEIEKVIEKMVEKQQLVELETIVPQLVKVHEVIKEYIDKIVEVPVKEEVVREVPVEIEKVVQVRSDNTQVIEVPTVLEKVVEVEKMKEYTNVVNHVEQNVQVVERFEQKEVPVYTTVEKIVEVPQILEKIVERIVVMPQVVEVLKYVHEICEVEGLGVGMTGDVQVQDAQYRELYGNSKKQLEILLVELRKLKTSQPNLRGTIDIVERFLTDFDRLAAVQRVVGVPVEKVVEKEVDRAVLVPTQDGYSLRNELAMSLLIEKLILEIKRIQKENPSVRLGLDDDVALIFFAELYDRQSINISADFKANLERYTEDAIRKFTANGGKWTGEHEMMLNTVLSERFAMANAVKHANLEIEKVKALADAKAVALREKDNQLQQAQTLVAQLQQSLNGVYENNPSFQENAAFKRSLDQVNQAVVTKFALSLSEPTRVLGDFQGTGNDFNRLMSLLREREGENELLRTRLIDVEKRAVNTEFSGVDSERTIAGLRAENNRLSAEIDRLRSQASTSTTGTSGQVREL